MQKKQKFKKHHNLSKSGKNKSLRKSLRKPFSFGKSQKKDEVMNATKSLYAKENQIAIDEESEGASSYESPKKKSVMEEKKLNIFEKC